MNYGYLHRGRIVEYDPVTGGYIVEIPTLAPGRRMGPYPSLAPNLPAGQRILLASLATSRDEMVIIGRNPGAAPTMSEIPGLVAALNGKADDSEITALDGRLDVVEPLVADHTTTLADHTTTLAGHTTTLADHTTTLADHTSRLDTAESTIVTQTARTTALEISSSVLDRDLYNDAIASMRRMEVVNGIALTNSTLYLTRLYARRSLSVAAIRMATAVAGTVGTCSIGLYAGSGATNNNFSLVRSGSITLTTLGRVTHNLSSSYAIADGTNLLVALLPVSYSVAPQIGGKTGVVHSTMLNPSGTFHSSVSKAAVGSLPATIDLTDGSWTTSITHVMWAALA